MKLPGGLFGGDGGVEGGKTNWPETSNRQLVDNTSCNRSAVACMMPRFPLTGKFKFLLIVGV